MQIPGFFIKNVYVAIKESYELDNTPYIYEDEKSKKPSEVKRKTNPLDMYFPKTELEQKFIMFLKKNKGSYLVTGHRGNGKTTFINKVIENYNKTEDNSEKLKPIRLNLAQSVLTEIDVLRMMVSQVYEQYCKFPAKKDTLCAEIRNL